MRSDVGVSVIVVAYDMARELPRTVRSFLPPYQRGIATADVEIVVVENGSRRAPVPREIVRAWPENVRYLSLDDAPGSPAQALHRGVRASCGSWVCPVVDGARMASPGLLAAGRAAAGDNPRAVVATIGLHLGSKPQSVSVSEGYDQGAEDRLLETIHWPEDGYRLFDVSVLGLSARRAWFGPIAESNAFLLSRELYDELDGYDERFDFPGGGIVNHDFFKRAVESPGTDYILLAGEGTFHQHHGGVSTSRSVGSAEADGRSTWDRYVGQYHSIRGRPYAVPVREPRLAGRLEGPSLRLVQRSMGEKA